MQHFHVIAKNHNQSTLSWVQTIEPQPIISFEKVLASKTQLPENRVPLKIQAYFGPNGGKAVYRNENLFSFIKYLNVIN